MIVTQKHEMIGNPLNSLKFSGIPKKLDLRRIFTKKSSRIIDFHCAAATFSDLGEKVGKSDVFAFQRFLVKSQQITELCEISLNFMKFTDFLPTGQNHHSVSRIIRGRGDISHIHFVKIKKISEI